MCIYTYICISILYCVWHQKMFQMYFPVQSHSYLLMVLLLLCWDNDSRN